MNIVFLSRRNLLALLNKLDRRSTGEATACAIVKQMVIEDLPEDYLLEIADDDLMVVAVEDEVLYKSREPGQMHPKDLP